jgi:hypothetical protein
MVTHLQGQIQKDTTMVCYISGGQGKPIGGNGETRHILGCENGAQAKWG